MSLRRVCLPVTTLALALAVSTAGQPPRIAHTAEPPLAGADNEIQQVGAQIPANLATRSNVPSVSVTIEAPAYIAHGKDIDYRLVVVNISSLPAYGVQVIHALPKGATLKKSEPKEEGPAGTNNCTWSLGTLAAGTRREIVCTAQPAADAVEWVTTARVRFEHGQQAKTKIAKPELKLKFAGPERFQQYDQVPMRLELINPGLLEVRDITVTATMPEGVIHEYDPVQPGQIVNAKDNEHTRSWTVPKLGPNQMQYLDYRIVAKRAGPANPKLQATAASGAVVDAEPKLIAEPPKLDLQVTGPTKRGVHQPATYRLTVRNAGLFPLRNVLVTDKLPPGVDLVTATDGNIRLDREVQWLLPLLNPNEARVFEMTTKVTERQRAVHTFQAAYRDHRVPREVTTEFDATAALQMEVRGSPDGVNVGDSVRYTVTVENTGSAPATRVRPVVTLPDQVTFTSADPSHRRDGQRVQFDEVTVPGGGKQTYTVTVKAVKAIVPAVVSVDLLADALESGPLNRKDSTTIASPTGR